MSNKNSRPKAERVKVVIPKWMMGGDSIQVATICGWSAKVSEDAGKWWVRNLEGEHGTDGGLLRLYKLADGRNFQAVSAYGRLHRLKRYDGVSDDYLWNLALESHSRIIKNFSDEPAALLMSMQTVIPAARTAEEAAHVVQETFSEYVLPVAPYASLYLLEISDYLGYRYAVSRALLATRGNVSADQFKAESLISGSSKNLFTGTTIGLKAYLHCMCASLSPDLWAYTVGRPGAVILVLFGGPLNTSERLIKQNIQLLASDAGTDRFDAPDDPQVYVKAAHWWVKQLSVLFSIITEPANYVDHELFDPAESTERLLIVEQMFQDCQSILTISHDEHARRALAFSVLKRMEGLVPGYSWRSVVNIGPLNKLLNALRADVPSQLHGVFLARAERAVEAVKDLEEGFSGSDNSSDGVPLPTKGGTTVLVNRAAAVTEWLLVIRNSLHGFERNNDRHRALIAAHDGVIPSNFADVAWLHLLDLITHPEKLAKFEHRRRREEKRK